MLGLTTISAIKPGLPRHAKPDTAMGQDNKGNFLEYLFEDGDGLRARLTLDTLVYTFGYSGKTRCWTRTVSKSASPNSCPLLRMVSTSQVLAYWAVELANKMDNHRRKRGALAMTAPLLTLANLVSTRQARFSLGAAMYKMK